MDSGTSLLAGPPADVQALASAIGAHNILGKYIVSCSADIGQVEFSLSGKKFTLDGKDLLIPALLGQCLLAVIPIDVPPPRGPLWILGGIYFLAPFGDFRLCDSRTPCISDGIVSPLLSTVWGW